MPSRVPRFIYICVDTPPLYSGDADLSRVWTVVDELPADTRATIVMKSTVPVGTGEKVRAALDARGLANAGYVSNPEFTAEGSAVSDFMEPDRIVIGARQRDRWRRSRGASCGNRCPCRSIRRQLGRDDQAGRECFS
jgi:UDPglucose 6-dehydrogenase